MKSLTIKSLLAASALVLVVTPAFADDAINEWKNKLRSQILSSNSYPSEAIRGDLEGTVKVRLKFDKDGDVKGVEFVEKSGHDVLDKRVFASALRISKMPALPNGQNQLSLVVPIRFELPDES